MVMFNNKINHMKLIITSDKFVNTNYLTKNSQLMVILIDIPYTYRTDLNQNYGFSHTHNI